MSMIKNRLEEEFELFEKDFNRMLEFYAVGYRLNPELIIYKMKQMEKLDREDEAVKNFYEDVYEIARGCTQMDSEEFFKLYCEHRNIGELDNNIIFNSFKNHMKEISEEIEDIFIDIYLYNKDDILKEYLETNTMKSLNKLYLSEKAFEVLYMYHEYSKDIYKKNGLGLYNVVIRGYENKNYNIYAYDEIFRGDYERFSEDVSEILEEYMELSNLNWTEFTDEFEKYIRKEVA